MSQSATEYQIREEMFATLYEDYQKPIERYLVKLVYNQEQASDLCQDTFKQLWEFLCKETVVKQYAYYKNWLYLTAKYRAIDYKRKHNKPTVYLSQSEGEENSWFDELRAEGHEELIEDWMCTQDDLLQLPPQQRDSLVQYALGFKQKEIAAKKNISESSVSAYMSLGRTELKELRKKIYPVPVGLRHKEVEHFQQEFDRISRTYGECMQPFSSGTDRRLEMWCLGEMLRITSEITVDEMKIMIMSETGCDPACNDLWGQSVLWPFWSLRR